KEHAILLQGKFALGREYITEIVKEGAPSAFKNITSIMYNTVVNNIISVWCTTEAMASFYLTRHEITDSFIRYIYIQ
ncbi:MAG: hypothetical protein IJM62_02595, partial [Lachnospiraceae bacterium]|nr:hypothetical protein [Lachnospiraceae bacterium]